MKTEKCIGVTLEFKTKNLRIVGKVFPEYTSEPESKFVYKILTYGFGSKNERIVLECGGYESFEACQKVMLDFIQDNFSVIKF